MAAKRAADRRSLAHAFLTFTQAAGSLEKSYTQLQGEVARLRFDLECANTELSRSLEETSRVRVFLGRVLEGLPCGVLVTDDCNRPRMVNPEARRLLRLDAAWSPEKNGACPAAIEALLSGVGPGAAQSEQEWNPAFPGEETSLGVSATCIENAPQGSSETIWILRDIGDQKRVAAAREAARRAQALAEISTVLAHEIRNPLGSMELFAGLLGGATRDMPEANQWVTHLQAGVRLLAATVNNVLQFHSQPCGKLVPTSLDRLLRETSEFLGPLARQRGLSIVFEKAGRFAVAADAHRLQQVFSNLSLNAFHAMKPTGILTICARPATDSPQSFVQVDFKDQGCGIDPAALERIFEAGFTTKAGSPGLGLSVCKSVVEQHGGTIRVESVLKQGSTLSIRLPLLRGPE